MVLQMICQVQAGRLKPSTRAGGEHQKVCLTRARQSGMRWSLFEDHVGVGAADAKGTDGGPSRCFISGSWPLAQHSIDVERTSGEVDFGVGVVEMEVGGDLAVVQAEHSFDQTGHASGFVEVT